MNKKEDPSRLAKPRRYLILISTLFVGVLTFQTVLQFAQTTESGDGKGRTSKPGELQYKPKPELQTGDRKMDPDIRSTPIEINGKVEKMEDHLAHPLRVQRGRKQPKIDLTLTTDHPQAKGLQRPIASRAALGKSHLHLVLRITEAGATEVLSAVEIEGDALISDEPTGDFVYEVTEDGKTLAVQAIPDPFELRSFSGPEGTPQEGHYLSRAKTATITVKVPNAKLAAPSLNKFVIQLYKVKPGEPLEKINPAVLYRLKQEKRLELRVNITGSKLAPQILKLGRKLNIQ